jgi:hypothetical protein
MDVLAALACIDPMLAIEMPDRFSRAEILSFLDQYGNLSQYEERVKAKQSEADRLLMEQNGDTLDLFFRNNGGLLN